MSSHKIKVLLVYEESEYGVLLPYDVIYSDLVKYLKKKFKVPHCNPMLVSYNMGYNTINIINDDDVRTFVNEDSGDEVKKLFIRQIIETKDLGHSSSQKNIHIDLNIPYSPNPNFIHRWKQENPLMLVPNPPPPPTLPDCSSHHTTSFHKHKAFDDKEWCIYEISMKCLTEGYQFRVLKSTTQRYAVECIEADCFWYIFSRRIKNSTKWRITNINDNHSCEKINFNPYHRNVTAKLLSKLIQPKIRDVTRVYRPKDIAHDFSLKWNIHVPYKKAWMAKQIALSNTQGCPIESFAMLPYYCYNLERENEGTVSHIDTDYEGHFKMCFIGFGVAIESFLRYMRPLIIIDAAHLKGDYLGTNLVAVGMDGNNQIIPIATGVSQGETGESWTWFLRKLKECIGEVPNLTIISDRHYAISLACNNVFPNAFHGYCCHHLMMNCGMQSDNLKELYWKTCKAYSREDFGKLMNDIQTVKPDAHQKLVEAGVEKWSRAMCPANRYNYMTSNSVESVNAQNIKLLDKISGYN